MSHSTRATLEQIAADGLLIVSGLILSWPLIALAAWFALT